MLIDTDDFIKYIKKRSTCKNASYIEACLLDYAHHYVCSSDKRTIGKWIDGNPRKSCDILKEDILQLKNSI